MSVETEHLYSTNLDSLIATAKVLVVGAGGIGCEVLKNLVLSGFQDIEVIDLDTIDVSNLNRQFLFRKEHVGKSKAKVARESVLQFNPKAKIIAHHDSVISANYGVNYMKKFSVVLNALDNRAARNQVNRVCLAADVPLVESGTSGYFGQVELIKKGKTKCYECDPKPAAKTYPGCTIRNTPSEHVHCIVWSKHLFNQLFGIVEEDEDVSPDFLDPEAGIDENGLKWKDREDGNVERVSTRKWAESTNFDPVKIFNKLFKDDIGYLLTMGDLWKKRKPPVPISWDQAVLNIDTNDGNARKGRDERIWTIKECAEIFSSCIASLSRRYSESGELTWDKDDNISMDFVTACANIRANIFAIDKKSRFETKSVAGNIIPAIATANAIIAGYVVLQTLKILENRVEKCQSVYLRRLPNPRGQLVVPEKSLSVPNPKCTVCSNKPQVVLLCDVNLMTCKEFESDVLKRTLNLPAPDVVHEEKGTVIISSEEEDNEFNYDKTLHQMGLVDGAILLVDDFIQNYKLRIILSQREKEKFDDPNFSVVGTFELDKMVEKEHTNGDKRKECQSEDDDDDIEEVMEIDEGTKKRRPEDEDTAAPSKRSRYDEDTDSSCVTID